MKKLISLFLLPFFINCTSIIVQSKVSDNSSYEKEFNYFINPDLEYQGFYVGEKKIKGKIYRVMQINDLLLSRENSTLFLCIPKELKNSISDEATLSESYISFSEFKKVLKDKKKVNNIYMYEAACEKDVLNKKIVFIRDRGYSYFSGDTTFYLVGNTIENKPCLLFRNKTNDIMYVGKIKKARIKFVERSKLGLVLWTMAVPVAFVFDLCTFPIQIILIKWVAHDLQKNLK